MEAKIREIKLTALKLVPQADVSCCLETVKYFLFIQSFTASSIFQWTVDGSFNEIVGKQQNSAWFEVSSEETCSVLADSL